MDACFKQDFKQTTVELTTSNDGWNDLATGIVTGISSGLSNDMITKIGNVIFGKGGDIAEISGELISSQPWIIVFICIGVVISVLTLIAALATCIWACTCRRSSKGIKSSCLNITGIIVAFISFGFIVAGIVLYALSTSSFVNGVLAAPTQLTIVLNNANGFALGATTQVNCAVDNGFNGLSHDIGQLPKQMIDAFNNDPSFKAISTPDYTALSDSLTISKPAIQAIVDELTPIAIADAEAQKQVTDALIGYQALLAAVAPDQFPKFLKDIGGQVTVISTTVTDTVNTQAGQIVTQATGAIDGMVDTVKSTVNSATSVITGVLDQVQQVLNSINDLEKQLNKNVDVSGWITAGFDSVIIVPCAIALIAGLLAFLVGIYLAFQKTSLPSKGCCSASCTLITFSIIVLTITFIVMIPSTLAMTLGYGAQLVCQPFFYDENLEALKAVDNVLPVFTVPTMTGTTVTLKFSEVMMSCEKSATFMNAVKGGEIIDLSVIENAIDPKDLADQLTSAIKSQQIPVLAQADVDNLNKGLNAINLKPPLDLANAADPRIQPIINQMNALATNLQPTINSCKSIGNSANDFTDEAKIKTELEATSTGFINQVYGELTNDAETFTSDLLKKTASCKPVYQSYEDLGMVACKQMAGGVQGMWAAAGLAALFFLPTVIAAFCIASALRGGKAKEELLLSPHDEYDPYKLPPMSSGVAATAPPHQQHDSLPRLTVDTSAAALAAAPYSESYTATAPIASAASDPWESSYQPESYPYKQQPAPSTAPFVDPLAYPVAAAAVAASDKPFVDPLAYESAGPSAYPRINVTAANRYYDNQSYTPSTLTRF